MLVAEIFGKGRVSNQGVVRKSIPCPGNANVDKITHTGFLSKATVYLRGSRAAFGQHDVLRGNVPAVEVRLPPRL